MVAEEINANDPANFASSSTSEGTATSAKPTDNDTLWIPDMIIEDMSTLQNTKRSKHIEIRPTLGNIPKDYLADVFPAHVGGINKGLDFNDWKLADDKVYRLDEAKIRYEEAVQTFAGSKYLALEARVVPEFKDPPQISTQMWTFNNDHYINTRAEAPKGLHGIYEPIRDAFKTQDRDVTGSTGYGRRYGDERAENPKKFPELALGVSMDVEPHVPTYSLDRFNDEVVDYIPLGLADGF